MPAYHAPIQDIQFIITSLQQQAQANGVHALEDVDVDLFNAIVEEAAKFAAGVMAPGNRVGDRFVTELQEGKVTTAPGWDEIYQKFTENGWVSLALPEEYGGQGLPRSIASAVWEMWYGSNLAFAMLPQLNVAQAEALIATGDESWRTPWLEKIVSGKWAATMNLTEPHAGSDLAATSMRAQPQSDGSYKLFGQKVYISFGEHELSENIVHLVLARLPDAPAGHRGLSLFLAPKFFVETDGSLGAKNDIQCVSLEEKMGVRGSPTCTLIYGDDEGATAYLVGEANQGLAQMFIMMNEARQAVALQGVGLSEKAYQMANAFARDRVQGAVLGHESSAQNLPIIYHPDVKRMLLQLRATTMAMRSLCYWLAACQDENSVAGTNTNTTHLAKKIDVLLPIAKGWCTEMAVQNSSLAIQVFGGMGYVEETGISQVLRDARVLPIFEGTTGIQAKDLLGRKILRDNGEGVRLLLADIALCTNQLLKNASLALSGKKLYEAVESTQQTINKLLTDSSTPYAKYAVSVSLLEQLGVLCGAWQLGVLSLAAVESQQNEAFGNKYCQAIQHLFEFYVTFELPKVAALGKVISQAGDVIEKTDITLI